eukprot:403119_1
MSADIPTEFDEESLPNGANRPPHSSVRPTHGGTVSSSIFKSVVKIFVVRCSPNYSRPWQMSSQSHSSSTGFVISNHRILCNAHGVRFAKSIRIRKHGDSQREFMPFFLSLSWSKSDFENPFRKFHKRG